MQIVHNPADVLEEFASLLLLGQLVLLDPMEKVGTLDVLQGQLDLLGVLEDVN